MISLKNIKENYTTLDGWIDALKWSDQTFRRVFVFGILFLITVTPVYLYYRKDIQKWRARNHKIIEAVKSLPEMQQSLRQNDTNDVELRDFIIEYVKDEKIRDNKQDVINKNISSTLLEIKLKTASKKELKQMLMEANNQSVYFHIRDTNNFEF